MKITGIYKIESKVNPNRIYIGSALDFNIRKSLHLSQLRKNKHHSKKLQYHYNKYGKEDLVFSVIEPCFPEFLIIREQYYIDTLKPYFNVCQTAGSSLGRKVSEETKKKMSNALKGRILGIHTDESHRKNSLSHIGHIVSDETKLKISQTLKGVPLTESRKLKISESLKGRKTSNGNTGMKFTEEHKRKLSEAKKNWYKMLKAS